MIVKACFSNTTERGVPFFTNGNDIKVDENRCLVIDGEFVTTYKEGASTQVLAKWIVSEKGCEFIKLDNVQYEIKGEVDKRMLINLEKEIYRA